MKLKVKIEVDRNKLCKARETKIDSENFESNLIEELQWLNKSGITTESTKILDEIIELTVNVDKDILGQCRDENISNRNVCDEVEQEFQWVSESGIDVVDVELVN